MASHWLARGHSVLPCPHSFSLGSHDLPSTPHTFKQQRANGESAHFRIRTEKLKPRRKQETPLHQRKMSFELPKLAYNYNALEPFVDTDTMNIHHTKHHQAYINNINNYIATVRETTRVCVGTKGY